MHDEAACDAIALSTTLPATPADVFSAWLSSSGHTAMTGGKADIRAEVGSSFTAWGGYIQGTVQALDPDQRIVLSWRTKDFPADAPDSQLELTLTTIPEGTRLDLSHRHIPRGQGVRYHSGWHERYFAPMARYFAGTSF